MSTILIIFAFIFVLGPLAKAYADRVGRELPPDAKKALADVERMRSELDQLTAQVSRLQEEQSFMLRLLSDGERRRLDQGRDSQPD